MNIPWYVHWYVHNSFTKNRKYVTLIHMKKELIRKIVKNGRGSYYINIPKEIMSELKWRERQKLVVRKVGERLSIEDWK